MHPALLPLLLALPLQETPAPRAPLRQVTVELGAGRTLAELLAADLDVVYQHPGTDTYDLVCRDGELARLEAMGLSYTLVHADTEAFYAERLASSPPPEGGPSLGGWLSPPFGQGSMGGFYTWAEVGSVLDQIAAAYPGIVSSKFSIGPSLEGRALWAIKVSDDPTVDEGEPEVRFDAMHHAREPESMQALIWTLLYLVEGYGNDPVATWLVDNREMWFLPVVNPDGYVYNQSTNPNGGGMWRKNRRNNGNGTSGVDLNRNYTFQWGFDDLGSSPNPAAVDYRGPSPASEPEVQAMIAFLSARSFGTSISCHTYSNLWLSPWGYTSTPPAAIAQLNEVGNRATVVNGYTVGPASTVLYPANGVTMDYDHGVRGTLAWSPELGSSSDGFWPPPSRIVPLAEENLEGMLRTAFAAGSDVYLVSSSLSDAGDGDGFYEAGEAVELTLTVRNGGRLATLSGVVADLAIASGGASVTVASHDFGGLASFTQATNGAAPLALAISPSATPGSRVDYGVTLSWDGFSQVIDGSFLVGVPHVFARDDLEVDLGWTAGLPGDTAVTGLWEYGDPVGTFSSSQPANPEDDATPGAAVNCFTTGNGSTTAGGDDVDDGFTTLLSPAIDLSAVSGAVVSYARWFADLTTADDVLEVSISDDDGASWTVVESLDQPAASWNESSFAVQDFVALTNRVRLRFLVGDHPNNSVCEAAVDDLRVEVYDEPPLFNAYGTAAIGTPIAFQVMAEPGSTYGVLESSGTGFLTFALVNGPLLLDISTLGVILGGTVPPDGLARDVVAIPNAPQLVGQMLYYQGIVATQGSGVTLTNRDELLFE